MGGPGSGRNAGGGGGTGADGSDGKNALTNKNKAAYNKNFTRNGYIKAVTVNKNNAHLFAKHARENK